MPVSSTNSTPSFTDSAATVAYNPQKAIETPAPALQFSDSAASVASSNFSIMA